MLPDLSGMPPGTPAPDTARRAKEQPLALASNQARVVEECFGATIMASVAGSGLGTLVQAPGFKAYRDRLLAASGSPKDPIEAMFLDQLAWAQLRLGNIHVQAATAASAEIAEVYNSAATKLMSEFRRTSLALREYRSPASPPQVTVVRQQNVAGGNQQVAFIDGGAAQAAPEKKSSDIELGGKPELLNHVEPAQPFATTACRTPELVEKQGVNGSRAPAAPRRRAAKSPVASLNGTENVGR